MVKIKNVLLVMKTLIKNSESTVISQLPKVTIKKCSVKKCISKLLLQRYFLLVPNNA